MNISYLLVIYAPLVLVLLFGIVILMSESTILSLVPILAPTMIAGFEAVAVVSTSPADADTTTDILMVQSCGMAVIAAFFMFVRFVILPLVRKFAASRAQPCLL